MTDSPSNKPSRVVRRLAGISLCLLSFSAGYGTSDFLEGIHPRESVLEEPLQVTAPSGYDDDTRTYYLPPGTTLVSVDETFPKRGSLYKIYLRVEGEPFVERTTEHSWQKSPLLTYNPHPEEVSPTAEETP